jgi:integrase
MSTTEYIDEQLCPIRTLIEFLDRTAIIRSTLPVDHTLFLTYLDKDDKKSTSIRPSTVANWIKSEMQAAGIDTTHFQAHSIRSSSSTKAVELGHSIQQVKTHGN